MTDTFEELRRATERTLGDQMRIYRNSNPYYQYRPTYSASTSHINVTMPTQKEKKMNAEVKVVRIKAGWVGQLYVADRIAWESAPKKNGDKARKAAVAHLAEVFA